MKSLEDRYRRLLAWYPRSHRDRYEEEMLAVLLDDARPGQRRPGIAESVDLIASGLGRRIGVETVGLSDRRWRTAYAVVGVLLPVALALKNLRPIGYSLAYDLRTSVHYGITAQTGALAVAWTLTAFAALLALRRTAAVLAAVAVVTHVGFLAQAYLDYPVDVVNNAPQVVVGITAAICLAAAEPLDRRFLLRTRLGRPFALAIVLVVAWLVENPGLGEYVIRGDVKTLQPLVPSPVVPYFSWPDYYIGAEDGIALALTASAVVAAAIGVMRLESGARRRFLALVAPALVLGWAISTYYAGFAYSSPQFNPPVLLVTGQWLGLAGIPLLTFAIAATIVHRRERTIELLGLGRAAQRQASAG